MFILLHNLITPNYTVDALIKLGNDHSFSANRVEFEYMNGILIKERFYLRGNNFSSLTIDCTKTSFLNNSGIGLTHKSGKIDR